MNCRALQCRAWPGLGHGPFRTWRSVLQPAADCITRHNPTRRHILYLISYILYFISYILYFISYIIYFAAVNNRHEPEAVLPDQPAAAARAASCPYWCRDHGLQARVFWLCLCLMLFIFLCFGMDVVQVQSWIRMMRFVLYCMI